MARYNVQTVIMDMSDESSDDKDYQHTQHSTGNNRFARTRYATFKSRSVNGRLARPDFELNNNNKRCRVRKYNVCSSEF